MNTIIRDPNTLTHNDMHTHTRTSMMHVAVMYTYCPRSHTWAYCPRMEKLHCGRARVVKYICISQMPNKYNNKSHSYNILVTFYIVMQHEPTADKKLYSVISVKIDSLPANTKRELTSSWTARVWFLHFWADLYTIKRNIQLQIGWHRILRDYFLKLSILYQAYHYSHWIYYLLLGANRKSHGQNPGSLNFF